MYNTVDESSSIIVMQNMMYNMYMLNTYLMLISKEALPTLLIIKHKTTIEISFLDCTRK